MTSSPDQFDIDVGGDCVRTNNSTIFFRITGPGSLQGRDAADAFVTAFSGNEVRDDYTVDTCTVIPYRISGTAPDATAPTRQTTRHAPDMNAAPIGAGVVFIAGFALRKRHQDDLFSRLPWYFPRRIISHPLYPSHPMTCWNTHRRGSWSPPLTEPDSAPVCSQITPRIPSRQEILLTRWRKFENFVQIDE